MLQVILNRLKEPSTYSGLSAILALSGIQLPNGLIENVVFILSGIAGTASIFLPEKK